MQKILHTYQRKTMMNIQSNFAQKFITLILSTKLFTRTISKFSAIGLVVFSSLTATFLTSESSYAAGVANQRNIASPTEQYNNQKIMMARVSGSINVGVDVLGIANKIESSIKSSRDRGGFVKNLMNTAFYASGQRYNVMVFNLSQNHKDRFRNVQFYGSAVYDGVTFGIWVFEDGEFTNQGDGGWINWAFRGWFDRNGSYVKFNKPPQTQQRNGTRYTVKAGDFLSSIAERFYGDGSEASWRRIYNANREVIGPDPTQLTAGMVLIIP